jgi:ABC-type spermidine/putrescine transport system permease subunit II
VNKNSTKNVSMNSGKKISYGKILLSFYACLMLAFLVIPSIMAFPMSFTDTRYLVFPPEGFTLQWYQTVLTSDRWTLPIIFSLKIAAISTLTSLILGTLASLALVRGTLPGKKILNIFFVSPIMVPVIITAFAVYGIYAKLHLIGTMIGMVLAHTILCVPFVILVITANLYRFNISLEMAARNLGANSFKTLMHITLPLIKPGIITAVIFSFITSLDDLVLAMFLVGTKRVTLPIRIFSQLQFRIDPGVAAASTIFILAAVGIVIILAFMKKESKTEIIQER